MVLKPDKGQDIVLINKTDYYQSLKRLFGDRKKFQVLDHDPSIRNLTTSRNYIQAIYKHGENDKKEMKEMRPKVAQAGRAHGLSNTKKYAMFRSVKDKIPTRGKSNIIDKIKCPRCGEDYVQKSDRCIITKLNEHRDRSDQPMFQYPQYCEKFLEMMMLCQLPDINTGVSPVKLQPPIARVVSHNWKILDSNTNWNQLYCLKSHYVKQLKLKLMTN